jgi:cytochrome c-type biogenesis protein CcmH
VLLPTSSLLFWAIATAMTALALAFVLPRLVSRREPPRRPSPKATNVAVFRDQMAELDRELAAGNLTREQHAQARVEIERRLLSDVDDRERVVFAGTTPATALALGIALPTLAFLAYALFGDPAAAGGDTAIQRAAAGAAASVGRNDLVDHLARSPRDGRSWVLLARMDFAADRYADAAVAYERAVAVDARVAADPAIWCEYADAFGMANGGSLAGKPRELVMRALARNPSHPQALEMAGSAAFEAGEYHSASGYWKALLAQLPAGTPAHRELAAAASRAEQLALATQASADTHRGSN